MNNEHDFQKLYEAVLNAAVDSIIVIDAKGTILTVNESVTKLFEYDRTELIGQNVSILMNKHDQTHHDHYLHKYNTTRVPKIIGIGREVVGAKKSGHNFPLRLAVSEVAMDGKILFTGIIHDLTELKASQTALDQLNKELESKVIKRTSELEDVMNKLLQSNSDLTMEISERTKIQEHLQDTQLQLEKALNAEKELNDLKSKFVTTASHEFRTPLAAILSSVSLIEQYSSEKDIEKRIGHIQKIKKGINYLTQLLNDFLSLSKIEEGKISVSYEPIDINEIIQSIIDELAALCKPNQQIIFHKNMDVVLIESDKNIMKNIIFNLVSNALKYSSADVDIVLRKELNYINFDIIDKGIGIPVSDQKNLFTRFYRGENVGNIQGTGLGLHIVHRYCEMLAIDIKINSIENQGTSVHLKIPTA